MTTERLQKVLAGAGVASRRKAEEIVAAGRVRVNGVIVTEMGVKVDPRRDRIEVDGRAIAAEKPMTVILNKPRGVVSTVRDPEGRPTVADLVRDVGARLFPVGRLDWATSGALLMTNDGELAHALTHPRFGVEKTYHVRLQGAVGDDVLETWRKGVVLDDGVKTRPAQAVFRTEVGEDCAWVQITIKEGRNRQIRRMAEATGVEVIKLKRISFAGITIDGVPLGTYRELTDKELARLKRDHVTPARQDADRRRQRARGDD
ncbi:MAG: rRNA pseudouridine synthase [Proteobacteria bacterium]|jgi:23S rRNA pseudouridine2605 synthase|nr:rRNA pseudouridine synthase [Pseudomonadota bacterium]